MYHHLQQQWTAVSQAAVHWLRGAWRPPDSLSLASSWGESQRWVRILPPYNKTHCSNRLPVDSQGRGEQRQRPPALPSALSYHPETEGKCRGPHTEDSTGQR